MSRIITEDGGTLPAEGKTLSDDWLESLRAIDEDTIVEALWRKSGQSARGNSGFLACNVAGTAKAVLVGMEAISIS